MYLSYLLFKIVNIYITPQHLEWRRLNKVDDILETFTPPEVMTKYFSMGRFGTDKFGCPGQLFHLFIRNKIFQVTLFSYLVYISAHGRIDLKGLMQSTTRKDYMRYQIWMSELTNREMRRENQKTGRKNSYFTFIADMDQLSMRQIAYKPGNLHT